jgi:hypothetical protein
MGNLMTCKINADTTDGLKLISDTSGEVDIQANGTTIAEVSSGGLAVTVVGSGVTDALKLKTTATNTVPAILFSGDLTGTESDISKIRAQQDSTTVGGLIFETKTGGTIAEKMRLTGDGNVGVGTTAPTNVGSAYKTIEAKGTDTNGSGVILATSTAGIQTQIISSDASGIGTVGTRTNHPCTFTVNNAEVFRINTAGQLSVGSTNVVANSTFTHNGDTEFAIGCQNTAGGTASQISIRFMRNTSTDVGSITTTNIGTQFNTSSDYRLKENVDYSFDATTRLKQLKPARFNFIADADTTVDGFLAHEVSSIVPEAITGTQDAVETWKEGEELPDGVSVGDNKLDDDGNTIPVYQSIDQSKLVPLLVKTIQELEARITALESE